MYGSSKNLCTYKMSTIDKEYDILHAKVTVNLMVLVYFESRFIIKSDCVFIQDQFFYQTCVYS